MTLALCSFVIHKHNSFSHGFTVDDYELIAGELTEDLAVIEDISGHKGTFVTMDLPLEAGSYQVNVQYLSTATGNTLTAAGASISNVHFRCIVTDLKPNNTHATVSAGKVAVASSFLCSITGTIPAKIYPQALS